MRESAPTDRSTPERTNSEVSCPGSWLCKSQNRLVAEYALSGVEKPIGVAEYQLLRALPEPLLASLPTVELLESELAEMPQERRDDERKVPAAWTLQQLREVVGYRDQYKFLLHDRDSIFASHLDESIRRLGVRVLKSPPRCPKHLASRRWPQCPFVAL